VSVPSVPRRRIEDLRKQVDRSAKLDLRLFAAFAPSGPLFLLDPAPAMATQLPEFNSQGVRLSCSGPLYKYSKQLLGNYWKKRWIYCDDTRLMEWKSEIKPRLSTPPAKIFNLANCRIEESDMRKNAFKITDRSSNRELILATETVSQYETWLEMLSKEHVFPTTTSERSGSITYEQLKRSAELAYASSQQPAVDDAEIILTFFRRFDIAQNAENPSMEEHRLKKLIATLDSSVPPNAIKLALRDMHVKEGGTVICAEFINWWQHYKSVSTSNRTSSSFAAAPTFSSSSELSPTPRPASAKLVTSTTSSLAATEQTATAPSLEFNMSESVHYAGMVDTDLHLNKATHAMLLDVRIPTFPSVTVVEPPPIQGDEDWNAVYQRLVETASGAAKKRGGRRIGGGEDGEEEEDEDDSEVSKLRTKLEEEANVMACLSLAAFQGEFVKMALEGVRIIVDEYSLPDGMKSATLLSRGCCNTNGEEEEDDDDDNDEDQNDGNEEEEQQQRKGFLTNNGELDDEMPKQEVFAYGGLLFRIEANSSNERDVAPSEEREKFVAASDEMMHKIAGNEQRGQTAMQRALAASWRERTGDLSLKPCTLLCTTIDYAGFRVSVMAPTEIDEHQTLVYGHSKSHNIFVNALPSVRSFLPKVAAQLNLAISRDLLSTTTVSIEERIATAASAPPTCLTIVEVLANYLQAHKCFDDRVYMLNFKCLLPPDLPRPSTNDLLTRMLRPEFIKSLETRLFPDVWRSQSQAADQQGRNYETRFHGPNGAIEAQKVLSNLSPSIADSLSAFSCLYKKRIPQLSSALDELSSLPVDSHGLTHCFHQYGVNMRHLGVVRSMCRAKHVKQMLMCEAVARCAKVLLNKSLRSLARKGKSESMLGEYRGRSGEADFVAQMNFLVEERKSIVLDLFNLVLGEDDSFWKEVLPDIIFQKFGIEYSLRVNKAELVHLPQLFLAMQYHTGTIFEERADYHFGGNSAESSGPVFVTRNILHYNVPSVKLSCISPGYVGLVEPLAEALLGSELGAEAAIVFRLRISLLLMTNRETHCPKHAATVAYNIYKLLLSLFLHGEYKVVCKEIRVELRGMPKLTPLAGRFLTLLMCAQFRAGRIAEALESFDKATEIYNFSLGKSHPIHSLHMCALADLYYCVKSKKQARLMLLMAQDVACRGLGDNHLTTASYSSKLAALYMESNEVTLAKHALNFSLKNYLFALGKGAKVEQDASECLYSLAMLAKSAGESDTAADYASQSIALAKTAHKKHLPPVAVSCLFMLSELLAKRGEMDKALGYFQEAWMAVRHRPDDYPDVGSVFALLSCKMLAALFSSLPLPTRSLVQTISTEVEAGGHGVSRPGAWEQACKSVFDALWKCKSKEFFSEVMQGISTSAFEDEEDDDGEEDGDHYQIASREVKGTSGAKNMFALQCHAITKLVDFGYSL